MRVGLLIVVALWGCGKHARKPRPGDGRAKAIACEPTRPPGTPNVSEQNAVCTKDEQCTAGKNGRCMELGSRARENKCTYDACTTDADCKTGGPCQCETTGNVCLEGNCRTDADCGAGGSCGETHSQDCNGGGQPTFYCRTPDDTCIDYDDCGTGSRCEYVPQVGHFTCVAESKCPVG